MIVTTDIQNILYRDLSVFGIDRYQSGNIPSGEVTKERITIKAKSQTDGKYWEGSFVEVNFCVPNINGKANLIRLGEIEREANLLLKSVTGKYDGTTYNYSKHSISTEEDTALKCHFINVRILFNVLNV